MRNVSIHARTTQRAYWSTIAGPYSPINVIVIIRFNLPTLYQHSYGRHTSGKFGFSDMRKMVVVLAVPGVFICMVNKRCNAVFVKNPSIIIQLNERV
jgi:hypothetical protein